ncbi:MAG: DUF3570 domain-containing protein [Nitrospirae bacterium]|nr:DUF3570 domain-containing protein [Nitrospirota bacterium]
MRLQIRIRHIFLAMAAILISCAILYAEGLKDKITLSYDYYGDNGGDQVYSPGIAIYKKITERFLIGVKMNVDAITSASISKGSRIGKPDAVTSATPMRSFDDVRYAPSLFGTYNDGDNAITLGGYYSTERDYTGRSFYANYIRQLNEQNTALGIGFSQSFDKWRPGFDRELTRYFRDETKIDLSATQILSQTFTAQLIYTFMNTNGFLASPYEYLSNDTFADFERYPSSRTGNALTLKLVKLINDPTAIHFSYRFFKDSWDITSHTFNVELYRDLSSSFTIGTKYRFYTQTKSDFTKSIGDYVRTDQYIAVDYRQSAFNSNTVGVMAILKPNTTETGLLDFNKMKIKGAINYYWTSSNDYIYYWYNVNRLKGVFTSISIDYEF